MVASLIMSCAKEQLTNPQPTTSQQVEKKMETKEKRTNPSTYTSFSCPDYESGGGCYCEFGSEGDCSPRTPCTGNQSYPTYDALLHSMFTQEEIDYRCNNYVKITEPELKDALKTDGFPFL